MRTRVQSPEPISLNWGGSLVIPVIGMQRLCIPEPIHPDSIAHMKRLCLYKQGWGWDGTSEKAPKAIVLPLHACIFIIPSHTGICTCTHTKIDFLKMRKQNLMRKFTEFHSIKCHLEDNCVTMNKYWYLAMRKIKFFLLWLILQINSVSKKTLWIGRLSSGPYDLSCIIEIHWWSEITLQVVLQTT